jgi:hypothetical protein
LTTATERSRARSLGTSGWKRYSCRCKGPSANVFH